MNTRIVEFKTANGALAISIPRTECAVIRHFQDRMPYGLFVSGLAPPPTDAQVIAGTILGIAGMAIDASIHRRHW